MWRFEILISLQAQSSKWGYAECGICVEAVMFNLTMNQAGPQELSMYSLFALEHNA